MLRTSDLTAAMAYVKAGQEKRPTDLRALCQEALRQVRVQPTPRDVAWLKKQALSISPTRQAA
jgi:hypothetical protein